MCKVLEAYILTYKRLFNTANIVISINGYLIENNNSLVIVLNSFVQFSIILSDLHFQHYINILNS